jgi:hypothetical protein
MTRKQIIYKNQKQDYGTLMPLCGTFSSYQGKSIKKLLANGFFTCLEFADHSKKSGLACLQNKCNTGPISIDKKIKKIIAG